MRFLHSGNRPRLIWVLFLMSLPILLMACGSGISEEDLAAAQAEAQAAKSEVQAAQTQIQGLEKQLVPVNERTGATELSEGTLRTLYIDTPKIGAKGYVVGDWQKGQVRVEVKDFPASQTGFEVFLLIVDIDAYRNALFVDGDPAKGVVADFPPMEVAATVISQWQSIGDLTMDDKGNGVLEYDEGDDLYAKGLNVMLIFEKVTPGPHDGPEDFSKLIVECNGPLAGTQGTEGRVKGIQNILSQ